MTLVKGNVIRLVDSTPGRELATLQDHDLFRPYYMVYSADGTRLAARIWLPKSAERAPVPAVLEAIPYRKNEHGAKRRGGGYDRVAYRGRNVVERLLLLADDGVEAATVRMALPTAGAGAAHGRQRRAGEQCRAARMGRAAQRLAVGREPAAGAAGARRRRVLAAGLTILLVEQNLALATCVGERLFVKPGAGACRC